MCRNKILLQGIVPLPRPLAKSINQYQNGKLYLGICKGLEQEIAHMNNPCEYPKCWEAAIHEISTGCLCLLTAEYKLIIYWFVSC